MLTILDQSSKDLLSIGIVWRPACLTMLLLTTRQPVSSDESALAFSNCGHFGMKAHIGVDVESGLVHTVIGTAANVNVVTQGHDLLHGQEDVVFVDAGYQGARKRNEATVVAWQVAMRPGKRRALDQADVIDALGDKVEQLKASVRAKVEHPFRVVKRQFGYVKVRYKGLAKNTAQLVTLFALGTLWMARRRLVQGS